MKKITTLIVFVIYILSIVFVGFFGMRITSYNPTVYATSVECTNSGSYPGDGFTGISIKYTQGMHYQLEWKVLPDNASQEVEFVYNTSGSTTITDSGLITFNVKGSFTVIIRTKDGSGKQTKVEFFLY